MNPQNQEVDVQTQNDVGEGESDFVQINKKDYESLNQTLGSLKREVKDLKKSRTDTEGTSKTNQPDESRDERYERLSIRQAGISHPDDIQLARDTARKWKMDIDEVLYDDDFKTKLEHQQTSRANTEATSDIKGGNSKSRAKDTPEYWIAKGTPPNSTDVPNRRTRAKIAQAMIAKTKQGKTFYND